MSVRPDHSIMADRVARSERAAPSRTAVLRPYGLALAYVGLAIGVRAWIEWMAPDTAFFVILLPAIVLAGTTCGTRPAIMAALVGGLAFALLFVGRHLVSPPPLNPQQIDVLLYVPACLSILWATAALRRSTVKAQAAEARLAEVFRQIPGAAAIISAPDGKVLLRSARSSEILGYPEPVVSASELGQYQAFRSDGSAYSVEDYPIARALRSGQSVSGERMGYRKPDGAMAELEVHAGPVRDRAGRLVAAVGMAFDVTARAETERRLEQSENEYRALSKRLQTALEAGALGLWDIDRTTRLHSWDAQTALMFGLPPQGATLQTAEVEQFLAPDERQRVREEFKLAIESGGVYAAELRGLTAQGDERWFVVRGIESSEPGQIIGVVRDVTEDRTRERDLREALQGRELLVREADHRIKNSLQLVVALLQVQRKRSLHSEVQSALLGAIARVNAVADAHLALQQSPDLRVIAFDQMLSDLCRRLNHLNPAIAITCNAGPISLDAEQAIPLGLLVSELVTNALRHAFAPEAPGSIAVSVQERGDFVELEVSDDGCGLSAGTLQSGLGTTIVRALAAKLEGTFATDSAPGRGVSVRVRFPRRTTA